MTDIPALSLAEMKAALQSGELSSMDIVDALLARADAIEPKLNALVHRFDDTARAAAENADEARARGIDYGPLHGLPVTIKESISTRGVACTLGVGARRAEVAETDAVVVQALRQAGAIVIAKTNVSQALLFHEADNPIWGATRNPFAADRVPGGSSGGEGAAVAAGLSPLGVGTDIGGSIRIPAHFCGVCGLKPTAGRWSMGGVVGAIAGQETIRPVCGPLTRTVGDLELVMRAVDGPAQHALDPLVPPVPYGTPPETLRVGYFDHDGLLAPSTANQRAVQRAVAALRDQGVTVVPFTPPRSVELTFLYFAMLSSDGGKTLEGFLRGDEVVPQLSLLRRLARLPGPVRQVAAAVMATQGEARVQRLLESIHEKSVQDLWALVHQRNQWRREVLEAWDAAQLDAVIGPPHATPAIRHGQSKDFTLGGCYSMRYNILDFPAGVVPVTSVRPEEARRASPQDRLEHTAAAVDDGSAGLPIGVQVATRPYAEPTCLAVMAAIERGVTDEAPRLPVTPS